MKRPTIGNELPEEAKIIAMKIRYLLVKFGIAATVMILAAAGFVDYQGGTWEYSLAAWSFLGSAWWIVYKHMFSGDG